MTVTTTYDETKWQLVPKVPTEAMLDSYRFDPTALCDRIARIQAMWHCMLSTAPPAPSAQQWLPIETAPRDGRKILLCARGPRPFVGHFFSFSQRGPEWVNEVCLYRDPAHWMPLPPPPVIEQAGGKVES